MQVWVGQLDARCKGQGPAVGGMHDVQVKITGDPGGTADAADTGDVFFDPQLIDELFDQNQIQA